MMEILLDGMLDTIKIFPYLFVTFLILEIIEHKISKKKITSLSKYRKIGPLLGAILGGFPQCGFSAMASNLYTSRLITMGTLIAIFLSTSDEMLPVMLSESVDISIIIKIIVLKIIIGIIIGSIVDLISKSNIDKSNIGHMCEEEHCHCKNSILKSSIFHALKTALFILLANIIINLIVFIVGENSLTNLLNSKNILVYFIASLIGLIPNCASSIVLTEVYITKMASIGVTLSGLLTGSGIGILLLFKNNKNIKENLIITSIIYFIGVIIGILVDAIV